MLIFTPPLEIVQIVNAVQLQGERT